MLEKNTLQVIWNFLSTFLSLGLFQVHYNAFPSAMWESRFNNFLATKHVFLMRFYMIPASYSKFLGIPRWLLHPTFSEWKYPEDDIVYIGGKHTFLHYGNPARLRQMHILIRKVWCRIHFIVVFYVCINSD